MIYTAVAAATAPWWLRRTRSGWAERFARTPPVVAPTHPGQPRILLHAVSVGEVSALRALVPTLAARGARVVVSATTDTGISRAGELFAPIADVVRYPLDASWAVRRFLNAVQPDVVGLVELEVWPNFVSACAARRIPIGVINGRLSERSTRGYLRLGPVIRPTFRRLDFAFVQDDAYRQRFMSVGVPPERCAVTGSMKFDSATGEPPASAVEALARALGIDRSRPVVVAGSTAEGEEALIHESWSGAPGPGVQSLRAQGVQLVVAPRHPDRFSDAADALPGCIRRTIRPPCGPALGEATPPHPADPTAHPSSNPPRLLDTIGELGTAYALATVVVLGRTFSPHGGSDPIEPIARGAAVIAGPDLSNFRDVAEGFERAGALVRTDRAALPAALCRLIADPTARSRMAEAGRARIAAQVGASARHADALLARALAIAQAPVALTPPREPGSAKGEPGLVTRPVCREDAT